MASTDLQIPPVRDDGLQIEERRGFQRRFWSAERAAWWIYFGFIVLAIAGVTGGGGYFDHQERQIDTGSIEAPLFARWETSDSLSIIFPGNGERHTLVLDRAFFDHFSIDTVNPHPSRGVAVNGGQRMEFPAAKDGPQIIRIDVSPSHPGMARYGIELDGESADLTTVVLP